MLYLNSAHNQVYHTSNRLLTITEQINLDVKKCSIFSVNISLIWIWCNIALFWLYKLSNASLSRDLHSLEELLVKTQRLFLSHLKLLLSITISHQSYNTFDCYLKKYLKFMVSPRLSSQTLQNCEENLCILVHTFAHNCQT